MLKEKNSTLGSVCLYFVCLFFSGKVGKDGVGAYTY